MSLQTQTVAIPITKGVDLTSEPRLVEAQTLLEATNSRFSRGGGSTKRRGHTSTIIRGEEPIPPAADLTIPWLFGWGLGGGIRANPTQDATPCLSGPHPNAGKLFGITARDQESILWSGDRMFSYTPSQQDSSGQISADIGNAVMPSLHAYPIAKVQSSQTVPEFADNGNIKLVAWLNPSDHLVRYSIYDSVSLAPIVINKIVGVNNLQAVGTQYYKVFALGPYIHIMCADSGDGHLKNFTINQAYPNVEVFNPYGPCFGQFDIWKVSETRANVVISVDSNSITAAYIGQNGSSHSGFSNFTITPVADNSITNVACCESFPGTGSDVTLAWVSHGNPFIAAFSRSGTPRGATISYSPGFTVNNISLAPKQIEASDSHLLVDLYFDSKFGLGGTLGTLGRVRVKQGATVGSATLRYNVQMISKAFTSGDRTYIWAGHFSTLQSSWVLMDESLLPVGHMDYTIANVTDFNISGGPPPCSVNWYTSQSQLDTSGINFTKFHLALGFKVRVPASSSSLGVFTEPSIKAVELDMLPTLRAAQAGRCLYFAGAQCWSYDGVELVEQGFHWGPELSTLSAISGGSLSNPGTYSYRVDLCYRNAQNEEVRSLSILTNSVATTGTNKKIILTIPTIPTRRTGSYFLIFRNANVSGVPLTNWWLLNSRDPTSVNFTPNDPTVSTVTFTDDGTVTDTAIQNNELHPATIGDTYLQPTSAPASEIISAGRDRLWVAGGELPPGQVAPSRLFEPGDTPAFNPFLNVQVDRSSEAITAIGFVGEITAFFRRNSTYVTDGDGPDNVSNGTWAPARLALADLGAIGQESLALITSGLMFQSPAGFRMLAPSGQLSPIGQKVDQVAKVTTISNAVVIDFDQEVRWYGPTTTFVYNYLYDVWSTWTITGVGAVRSFSTHLGLVAQSNGYLLIETDGVWTDGSETYTHRVRLPWLRAGQLGDFQRVKRVQGLGHPFDPNNAVHNIRVELYYDEDPNWQERFDWSYPDTSNNDDTWGSGTWGQGAWGDTNANQSTQSLGFSDLGWEWVRQPNRQKCSVFSIAIEDNNTPGPGFVLNGVGLSLAIKPDLNRTPVRGGTSHYRG